jgi:hypothetical protein
MWVIVLASGVQLGIVLVQALGVGGATACRVAKVVGGAGGIIVVVGDCVSEVSDGVVGDCVGEVSVVTSVGTFC